MANAGVFESGYNEGLQIAARQRARKEAQPEANLEEQHAEFTKNINALQTKYSSLLGPKGEETPESLRVKYALTQALVQRDALQKQPQGAATKLGGKIGELLHMKKKPEAESVTTQSAGVSLPASAGVSTAENAYQQATAQPGEAPGAPAPPAGTTQASTVEPAQPKTLAELRAQQRQRAAAPPEQGPALTPQAFASPAVAPAPARAVTVKGPALTPGQLKEQAKTNQRAQQEAALLLEAAPMTPQQEAVQAARAQAAGKIETVRAGLAAIKEFHPSAPPEELERLNNEYLDVALGTKEKPGTESYKTQSLTLDDGSTITAQQDVKSGRWSYLNGESIPADVLRSAKIAPKAGTAKAAWSRDERGRIYSVNLDPATHQEIAGTRNYDLVPPASLTGRITTGQFHYVDENGQVHEVAETRTSTPMGGRGGAPAPAATPSGTPRAAGAAAPASAGAALPRRPVAPAAPRAARGGAGAGRDKVIGWKGTKEYTDARTQYDGALVRMETMDKNLRHALNGDQQSMLSLVAQHIGMTLGAQKGARINQAVWNEAVASAPWLDTYYAKVFHNDPKTGEMVFDGWKSGVTLTDDQMRSMVSLAHEQVDTLKESLDRIEKQQRPGYGGTAPSGGGGEGDKALADRLAKALGG